MNSREEFVPWGDDTYFKWLCGIVKARSPWEVDLCRVLHSREFEWTKMGNVARDENRAIDGKELRRRFMGNDVVGLEVPASVLEVLVALAINIDNGLVAGNGEEAKWFWLMMGNLGLMAEGAERNYILDRWMYRRFSYHGVGSPFPLKHAKYDQRKVELWLQACGYFSETLR